MDHIVAQFRKSWHNWKGKRSQIPESLVNFESRAYCQNGEDGILDEIFNRIGVTNKFSVEFGIGDGTECCTRNLLMNRVWRGLLIEGSESSVNHARSVYRTNPGVKIQCDYITRDNILDLFCSNYVPDSPDLLVVDIDGNDYWVLERIFTKYHPRVLVCEYNARWVPPTEWIMPYNPGHIWDGSAYFGASLTAIARLAQLNGFTLVCCESRGVNSFFVSNELIGKNFPDYHLGMRHYAPPHYGRGYGHQLRFRQ
jgi:hypothetical protein